MRIDLLMAFNEMWVELLALYAATRIVTGNLTGIEVFCACQFGNFLKTKN
jgi:hypothetical protein